MSFFTSFAESIKQDVRFAIRGLRESPLFAVAGVCTLALGIAANTAIFSVVNAVLLDSLPFRFLHEPGQIAMIWERAPRMGQFFADRMPVRQKDYLQWKASSQSFQDMAIWRDLSFNVTDAADIRQHRPERLQGGEASASLLPLLGVKLQLGRMFRPQENQAGNRKVTIISDGLYRSRFAGDPEILGKPIRANGVDFTIIGVLPSGFDMPAMWGGFDRKTVAMWIPQDLGAPDNESQQMNCFVYGRLKNGITVEHARAEMNVLQKRLAKADNNLTFFNGVNVSSLKDEDVGADLRRSLVVLQAAVGFVLLIACANVANLLLTRAVGREKEMAIRAALGAGRLRLLRQMLTESLLLSGMAGVLGVLLGYWIVQAVAYLAPKDTHGLHEMRLQWPELLFTLGVTIAAGVLFGFAPYFHIRKQNVNETLNRSSRSYSGSSSGLRNGLSIAEVALSVILLIGAGLMVRTLATLMSTDLGFQRDHLLSLHITLPEARYKTPATIESIDRQLLTATTEVAGVKSVLMTTGIPMQSFSKSSFTLQGHKTKDEDTPLSAVARVDGRYFETLGTTLIAGRTLRPGDASSGNAGVAVVNRSFAARNGGEKNIFNEVIEFNGEDGKPGKFRIVGIVADEHQLGPDAPADAEFFLPAHALSSFYLIARTSRDPLSLAGSVQSAISKIDGDLPVGEVRSMDGVLREWTAPRRFVMSVLLGFAGLALVLAGIGLYSVLAYGVTLRTREIGIRVALGADPTRVARSVVIGGCKLAAIGIVIGVAASLFLARFMQSLIYGVSATDPLTFAAVPAVLALIAIAASYLPARKAARLDPLTALRAE